MRARAEIEVRKGDRESIVVTEIPYQVNKARLIEQHRRAACARSGSRASPTCATRATADGMRIVVDVRKGEPSQVILNNLYKHTPLQDTFGVIMLAIVDQRPRVLNLLGGAASCSSTSAATWCAGAPPTSLRKAEARAHILEGYVIALDHLDEVIALIRGPKTPEEARTGLIERVRR